MFPFPKIQNLSIGKKIFIGFGVIIAIFVGQSFVSNTGFEQTARNFGHYGQLNSDANAIIEFERTALELQRSVLAFTYSGYGGLINRVHTLQKKFRSQLGAVQEAVGDPLRKDILRRIQDHFRLYQENFDAAVEERTRRDNLIADRLEDLSRQISSVLSTILATARQREEMATAAFAGAAQEQLLLAHRDAIQFVNAPDSSLVHSTRNRLTKLDEALDELSRQLDDEDFGPKVERLERQASDYRAAFIQMVQATRGYMYLVYVVMAGEAAEIDHLAKELKERTLDELRNVEGKMAEDVTWSKNLSLFVSIFAAILGLILAWWITRTTVAPINEMTSVLTGLAGGRMDLDIRERGRGDEIGEMARAAQVFKEKAEELERSNTELEAFAYVASHDLREPLRNVTNFSTLLSRRAHDHLDDDEREYLKFIHAGAERMDNLVADLLNFSRVGRLSQPIAKVATQSLLDTVLSNMHAQLVENDAEVEISGDLPVVMASPDELERLFMNLIGNALKYRSPDRTPRIVVDCLPGGGMWEFRVRDNGIGIQPNKGYEERVFRLFQRLHQRDEYGGGTGIGLAVSKKIVERHGGRIWVESPGLDQGATFHFTLPVAS